MQEFSLPNQIQEELPDRQQAGEMGGDPVKLDYGLAAELFPSSTRNRRPKFKYRRFGTAAEAIRFAVEGVSRDALSGAYLEVDEMRFGCAEILDLYDSAAYPLDRRAAAPAGADGTHERRQGPRAALSHKRPILASNP
jgi:hypothetical protein